MKNILVVTALAAIISLTSCMRSDMFDNSDDMTSLLPIAALRNPSVTITSAVTGATNVSPIPVQIVFKTDVTGFDVTDLAVGNGSASNLIPVSGATYTADLLPSGDGPVTVDIAAGAATTADGKPNRAAQQFSIIYDTIVNISSVSMQSNNAYPAWAKSGDTVTVTFVQGEHIQTPTVTICGNPAALAAPGAMSSTWLATYTMQLADPEGPVTFLISGLQDDLGNTAPDIGATTDGSSVTYSHTAPAIASVTPAGPLTGAQAGAYVTVNIQFDKDMDTTYVPATYPEIHGLTTDPYVINDSCSWLDARNWQGRFYFNDNNDNNPAAVYTISGFKDVMGNVMALDTSHTVAVNTQAPVVDNVSVTLLRRVDLGTTVNVNFHFDTPMNDSLIPFGAFVLSGINTHTITHVGWSPDKQTWYGQFVLDGIGSAEDDVQGIIAYYFLDGADGFQDAGGNAMAADSFPITFDTKPPAITSFTNPLDYTEADLGNAIVSFTFDEPMNNSVMPSPTVTGLAASPYTVTATAFASSNWAGSFPLVDSNEDTTTGTLTVGGFEDLAGNVMPLTPYANMVTAHTSNPGASGYSLTCLAVPVTTLSDIHDGQNVLVEISFDQAMDTGESPSLTVGGLNDPYVVTTTTWLNNQQWQGSFTFTDDNETGTGTIMLGGFHNSYGNAVTAGSNNFSVDTENPTVTGRSPLSLNRSNVSPSITGVSLDFSENMSGTPPVVQINGLDAAYFVSPGPVPSSGWDTPMHWVGSFTLNNFNQEASGVYSISGASDLNGNLMVPSNIYTLAVDTIAPTILSATSLTPDGTYAGGQSLQLTLTFSETVNMTTGSLELNLNSGRTLNWTGINSDIHSETFNINAGETTSGSNLAVSAANFVGGSLMDAAGNPMTDFTINPANNLASNAIKVDAVQPVISYIYSSGAVSVAKLGDPVNVTLHFSKNVNLTAGTLEIPLNMAGATPVATGPQSGNEISATYTVLAGHETALLDVSGPLSLIGATLKDDAGNDADLTLPIAPNRLADNDPITVDGVVPTITDVTAALTPDGSYGAGYPIGITVQFSEPVILLGGPVTVHFDGGGSMLISDNSMSGVYTVGPTDNSTDLYISSIDTGVGFIRDAAGNNANMVIDSGVNLAATRDIKIDTIPPHIDEIGSSAVDGIYHTGQQVDVYLMFNERVTLSGGGNITVNLTTSPAHSVMIDNANNTFYVYSYSYTVSNGDLCPDLNVSSIILNSGSIHDAAGNIADLTIPPGANLADLRNIIIDAMPPTITAATTMDADADGRIDHYKVTLSEPVDDSSFPGYSNNSLGSAQSNWTVAGYANVVLAHWGAAPETDTVNDNIIYLKFNEMTFPDTGAKPDLQTSAAGGTIDLAGNVLGVIAMGTVTETDGAKPRIESVVGAAGSDRVAVTFTEPVDSSAGATCDGSFSGIGYTNVNGIDADHPDGGWVDGDACDDSTLVFHTDTAVSAADIDADQVSPPALSVYDNADNIADASLSPLRGLLSSIKFSFNTTSGGADVAGDVSDFPVLIRITNAGIIDAVQNGAPDIRFIDPVADGGKVLPYQVERWDKSDDVAEVWVLVPTVNGSSATDHITMYYNDKTDGTVKDWQAPGRVFSLGTGDSFAGVWHMSESSGTTVYDSTVNKNNSSVHTSIRNSALGVVGPSQYFDGSTFIQMDDTGINNGDALDGMASGGVMVSAWAKPDNGMSANLQSIIAKQALNASTDGYQLYARPSDGTVTFRADGSDNYSIALGDPAIEEGWYYFAAYLSTGGTGYIYFNGGNTAAVVTGTPIIAANETPLTIGRQADGSSPFNGYIDEVRVENKWRGADWVKLCYENQKPDQTLVTSWYDDAWNNRIKVTVDRGYVPSELNDFPVYVNLGMLPASFFTSMSHTDGSEIVVTAADGFTKLPRELVSFSKGGNTGELWFRAPVLTYVMDTCFYIYYNSSSTEADSAAVWSNGYAGVWHLQDSTVSDSTGNHANADIVLGTFGVANFGYGVALNGTTDYIRVPNSGSVTLGADFTITAWFAPSNDFSASMPLISKNGGFGGFELAISPMTNIIELWNYPNSGGEMASGNGTINAGLTGFYTLAVSGTSCDIFYDGTNASTDTVLDAASSTTTDLYFGKYAGSAGYLFGVLDEIHISNVYRGAGWHITEFNNQRYPIIGGFYKAVGAPESK